MNTTTARTLAILLTLPLIAACGEGLLDATGHVGDAPAAQSSNAPAVQGPTQKHVAALEEAELAYPDAIGAVTEAYYAGQLVEVEEFDGQFVYEGDIVLHPEMVRFEQPQLVLEPGEEPASLAEYNRLTARTQAHWPEGVIPYAIDPALPNQQRITDAIAHWEEHTNLDFVAHNGEADYLYFTTSSGCSSYIGKIGGRQPVWLSSSCSTGNTIHEIGHAIGLWHEQSRVDRDEHVTIHWDNIQSGREHNFQTYAQQGWDGDEFTADLDLGSIMMYGSYSFSGNGQPTITTKDGSTFQIQRSGLSSGDIEGVNQLYPADDGEPQYVNGESYVIHGITVLRYNDKWYYYHRTYGWREVIERGGYWYYA